jgi:hypothetical protein
MVESANTTYFISRNPTGKLIRKEKIREAICGLKA